MIPTIGSDSVAWIDTDQMREIDRIMIEDLHIELLQMMENAGHNLATLVRARFAPTSVAVYVGAGGNGGGGLVAARHLANVGIDVHIVLSAPEHKMSPAAAHQLDIVKRLGLHVSSEPASADVALDALIGYGLIGSLRGETARLAQAIHLNSDVVVSLDAPTGLDTSTGSAGVTTIRPDATLTLCLPKVGLGQQVDPGQQVEPAQQVGELYLADISVPPSVTEHVGNKPAPPFELGPILRLT